MTIIVDSESGSISQRHGSANLDPHQNVIDPEHWSLMLLESKKFKYDFHSGFTKIALMGTLMPQSSPPSLQLIWSRIFWTTLVTFFASLIVLKLITLSQRKQDFVHKFAAFRIHVFLCGSGSADLCLWLMDPDPNSDPDPAIFVIDLQDELDHRWQQKINFLTKFFCLLLLKVHLHYFQR